MHVKRDLIYFMLHGILCHLMRERYVCVQHKVMLDGLGIVVAVMALYILQFMPVCFMQHNCSRYL